MNEKKIPIDRAAKLYGVPAQTLRDRVKGHVNPVSYAFGGETTFSKAEEETLVEHVETVAHLGYGLSNIQLQHLAGEMAFDMGKKKKNKPMSNNWLYGFLSRWEGRLASVNPRKLDSNRAKSSTPEIVDQYFKNLEEVLEKYDLKDKPHLIYNIDETGLQPEHRPPNVVANPNFKTQAVTSPRSTTTTLISCVNALGNTLPPYFVFKGKRFNPDLIKGASPGTNYTMTESGWSNAEVFETFLKDHFIPYARPSSSENQPILIIYDGHASHKSPHIINWAKQHNLVLFVLPAHTSHILQPLDVSVFGPFKNFYYSECSIFMQKNIGRVITKYDMCAIACRAFLKAMSPHNIQAGFRKTGIFPFNKDTVKGEQLYPCENFREERPLEKVNAVKAGKEAVSEFLRIKEERKLAEVRVVCDCGKKKTSKTVSASGREITGETYMNEILTVHAEKSTANLSPSSPQPSTSGIQKQRQTEPMVVEEDTDTDSDEIIDSGKCCVCGQNSPPNLNDLPNLKIVNWAQCDKCDHWVHLAFCSSTRVVRRHSPFVCQHC